ncbi:MAG: hypothetical protein DHS20C16_27820 [Phycisphaerae bacterium]|nr:MAG: hypothetical protein DHS20C16_27820 [Phycisphaerae bacterium]
MVRLRSGLMRTTAAIAVGALLGMPAFASAGAGSDDVVVTGATGINPSRNAQVSGPAAAPDGKTAQELDEPKRIILDYDLPGEVESHLRMKGFVVNQDQHPGAFQSQPVHVFGSDSNRALGDNDTLLYAAEGNNALAIFHNNHSGDDVITIPFGSKGQAFVIEEIEFAVIHIAGLGIDTWAEITFYDLDEDVVAACTAGDPTSVRGERYGRVVANLGQDDAEPACNTSIAAGSRRTINLLTGVVTGFADAPLRVIDPNGVKVNTIGAGEVPNMGRGIPMGPGDLSAGSTATGLELRRLQNQMFFEIHLGVPNASSNGILTAPPDACSTLLGVPAQPGGYLSYNNGVPFTFGQNGFWGDLAPFDGDPSQCSSLVSFGGGSDSVYMVLRGTQDADCDTNGIVDEIQLDLNPSDDDGTLCSAAIAANGIVDDCECLDCNFNGFFDVEEIAAGSALDCNNDNIPDDCQVTFNDCNSNSIPDDCDIASGLDTDCQGNGIPDLCDLDPADPDANGFVSIDCDGNAVIDFCERQLRDCNANGEDDFCDILFNDANDFDANGVPDACGGICAVLDFEDTGDVDADYALAPVHDQPFDGDDTPTPDPTTVVNADWQSIDFDAGAFTGEVGVADVSAGSIGTCGGGKTLVFEADGARSLGYVSPPIPFSSPDVGTVVVHTPLVHSISFDIAFSDGDYQVDWDFFFDNVFDTAGNSWRAFLQFETRSDGAREINLFHGDGVLNTGVDWFTGAGVAHNVRLEFDYLASGFDINNNGINLTDAGTLYWDGAPIGTFTPRDQDGPASGAFPFMHRFTLQNDANTSGLGAVAGETITVDCITYKSSDEQVPCSAYKLADGSNDSDCDLDGVCDSLQIAQNVFEDLNTNGVLDHCEGYCIDCNHNGLPDSFEILNTNGLDDNGNGILDVCERSTHDIGFEADEYGVGDGFATGLIEGQLGWRAFLDADGVVSSDAAPGFKTGSQFLIVQDRDGAVGPDGLVVGPRQAAIADSDIELWSWDWRTTATGGDIGFVQVEILDLCLDGPAVIGTSTGLNAAPFLEAGGAGNVGLRLRPDGAANGTIDVEMLGITSGARQYSSTSAVDIQSDYQSAAGFSAGIEILNRTGRLRGYWVSDQSLMDFLLGGASSTIHSEGEHAETQTVTSIAQVGINQRTSGGDSQVLIRISDDDVVNGQFGTNNDAQYWFDNFTYRTFADCDFDGLNDLLWVENTAGLPGASTDNDMNGDDIPDRCQDCDEDCTFATVGTVLGDIARLSSPTACLDPCEIDSASGGCSGGDTEADCNANGIPDNCDTADGLTDNGDPDDGFLHIGWYDSGATCISFGDPSNGFGCQFYRSGGGSGDADGDGVPDECQIAGGADDCNENGLVDLGEIAGGTATDANNNMTPDECEADCNNNGRLDVSDLQGAGGNSIDQFPSPDGIPDECCPAGQGAGDLDGDGDVDAADYLLMQECGSQVSTDIVDCPGFCSGLPGPNGAGAGIVAGSFGGTPATGLYSCGCGDINGDGIIDECDMQSFQLLITGP